MRFLLLLLICSISMADSQDQFSRLYNVEEGFPSYMSSVELPGTSFTVPVVKMTQAQLDLTTSVKAIQSALQSGLVLVLTPETPQDVELKIPFHDEDGIDTARVRIHIVPMEGVTASFLLVNEGNGKYKLVQAFGVSDMIQVSGKLLFSNRFEIAPVIPAETVISE